ncbi:leucine-rich repeat-containing protein kinase family protein [Methylobacterium sp. B4]|uniref:leucine-rich repeat-containing protein kinase family protein n=1 Tax=Methylobacterium sp. B4 TaxID=1938755 RepID=UPI000D76D283|nr:leucine-rich repeat-containing protein kinase family protein [Methylobacterium sp. B4]PXW66645.1 leucine rich repeat (LRR) protein [Methylobacterium sp. B4]
MNAPSPPILDALRRGDLAGARELRFDGPLRELPSEIFGLADTLERLDLSGCGLSELPDDLGRLHRLRVLFCSGNRFERLPPALGDCASLSQVGFRATGLREVPAEALPPKLRWLTLTDNRIEHLPDALGERPDLQKLMLAGNRLRALPPTFAGADRLELLRLSANRFETLPPWLVRLPRLAWIAWAGNPFEGEPAPTRVPRVSWDALELGAQLGEGASGRIHRALWRAGAGEQQPVAVKLFKGRMTSDGLPEREMAACLAAGRHPNLTGALGQVEGHPEGTDGLIMPLIPDGWRVLAGPPSLESCSRDVYAGDLSLPLDAVRRIARAVARAAAHLHGCGLLHGDLYAHNTLWDGRIGEAVLSDFGAACRLPSGEDGAAWQRVETRSWGILLGELLERCGADPSELASLRALERACLGADPRDRPSMLDILHVLSSDRRVDA